MTSAARLPTQPATEPFVLSKLQLFADFHLWPDRETLNPDAWLENFKTNELPYALNILHVYLHFNDRLTNALFHAAFHSLSAAVTKDANSPGEAVRLWNHFLSSLTVTYVQGESPGPTDSGYLFARKARQITGMTAANVVHPPVALRSLLEDPASPLVFVDDFIGSGQQMIVQWHRTQHVDRTRVTSFSKATQTYSEVIYIPIVATSQGLQNVAKHCPALKVRPVHILDAAYSLTSPDSLLWPTHLKSSASDVMFTASKRAGILDAQNGEWQGFANLALPLSFDHSVPDATLPLIYWEKGDWQPLIRKELNQISDSATEQFQQRLANVFSGYRAEWLGAEVFRLFTKPSYFPQLLTSHPCFLVGGRGTGKTTTLRCLSYQGQAALRADSGPSVDTPSSPFVGLYYRVNTNRVRAFGGPEIPPHSWQRLFGHYLNLELCDLVLNYLKWHSLRYPPAQTIAKRSLQEFATSMHLSDCTSIDETAHSLNTSRLTFEALINNVADRRPSSLSLQAAPLDLLMSAVKALPHFANTSFFFLLDEYENFDSPQQRAVNTLIKHCGELYSFKVAVREFGDSERATLNDEEKLRHPADYKRIELSSALRPRFSDFAARVCRQRLKSVFGRPESDITRLFPILSPEQEAILLGVDKVATPLRTRLLRTDQLSPDEHRWIASAHALEIYTLGLRAEAEGVSLLHKIQAATNDSGKWRRQYNNYKYSYLFTIRKRKAGISKYYSGWNVYCQLASSNIRFLLELVDQALTSHLESAGSPGDPISPELQTNAAYATGQKSLRELEGLSLSGAKLTRFLLGLGRVFQMMAEDPVGHTPEVNQFHLAGDVLVSEHREFVTGLLKEGVMHLALSWYRGSKLQDITDIRQFDYGIHPIFAPLFGFSHRRKRKILLEDDDFPSLIDRPSETIARILRDQRRTVDADMTEQMRLFSVFYEKHDS